MTDVRRVLTDDERRAELATSPEWRVVSETRPDNPSVTRTALYRQFHFGSFDDALAFMQAAAPYINQRDHHPRWENSYHTVSVWLSTGDVGHQITMLDFDLARHLDDVSTRFSAPPK